MKKIITFMLLMPTFGFSMPGFHVNNTTDLQFATMIGDQKGLPIGPGKEINVPFGPISHKCRVSDQLDTCLLNIFDNSNNSLVAVIPFDPKSMTVIAAPEIQSGYQDLHFYGWETGTTVKNISIYRN